MGTVQNRSINYGPPGIINSCRVCPFPGKKINQNRGRPETPTAVQETLASRLSADIELYKFAKQRLYLQYKRIGVPWGLL